jgi:NTE family protein
VKFLRLILIVMLCTATLCVARERKKLGLVLSGGGAKGLAHIGVLKVLEEAGLRPDFITGTSIGAVVGGMYAMGYTIAQIESVFHAVNWNELMQDRTSYSLIAMEQKRQVDKYIGSFPIIDGSVHLPGGIIAGQRIGDLLARLTIPYHSITTFRDLPIPFACVATDIATGKPVLIDSGDVANAIRASMSIPTIFTPMELGNTLFVDGGLVRNFPVEEVRRMGAEIVIGVDVGTPSLRKEEIKDFLQVMVQATQFADAAVLTHERELCDLVILPDITGISLLGFNDADVIIRRGEIAARIIRPKIDSLAVLTARWTPNPRPIVVPDQIYIDQISVDGLTDLTRQTIKADFGFDAPVNTSITEIERGIERIYSSQEYDRVSYRIQHVDGLNILYLTMTERTKKYLRAGIRYDSYSQATLLLNSTLWNLGKDPGLFTIDLKLGRQQRLDLQYAFPLGLRPGLGIRIQTVGEKYPVQITTAGKTVGSFLLRTLSTSAMLGTLYDRTISFGVGLRGEYTEMTPEIYSLDFSEIDRRVIAFANLWLTTFDRPTYPHSGMSVQAAVDATPTGHAADQFSRGFIGIETAAPLGAKLVLFTNGFYGLGSKSSIPVHYNFVLGGIRMPAAYPYNKLSETSFMGIKDQELIGVQAHMLAAGARYEAFTDGYVQVQANVGNTFNDAEFTFKDRRYEWGGGVTFGYLTPIGPLEFSLMRGPLGKYLTFVNIGFEF